MSSQESRLDRQVILLETGSTQVVRNMAADQLGDLAKQHPEQTLPLLSRVYPYLLSKNWETRVTAARAVGGIVSHAPLWDPNGEDDDLSVKNEEKNSNSNINSNDDSNCNNINSNINDNDDDNNNDDDITNSHNVDVKKEENGLLEVDSAKVKIEQEMKVKWEELSHTEEWLNLQDDTHYLTLDNWNLSQLLKSGKTLLASSANEFDSNGLNTNIGSTDDDNGQIPNTKQLKRGNSSSDLKKEQSVDSVTDEATFNSPNGTRPTAPPESKSSARMLAMARRKRKIQAKTVNKKPVDLSQSNATRNMLAANVDEPSNSPTPSPTTLTNPKLEITEQSDEKRLMVESMVQPILEKHEKISGFVWQFQGIYELLVENLTNEQWETRHGAALGLRELMKKHAPAVGRLRGESRKANDLRNYHSLEDLATRLLTIFALDRFSDFINDTAVAPVRESAAQTLATLLLHLDDEVALKVFYNLEQLVLQDPKLTGSPNRIWQATHGGLLGIRYFVSIKTDFLFKHNLLDNVVNVVLYGLKESDDDVQSVSAAILSPITSHFVLLNTETLDLVLTIVWGSLTHLDDDLSSSVSSVMDLLAKLCKHEQILAVLKQKSIDSPSEWSFKSLVPQLYPFLRHSITMVRKSVLNLLSAFLSLNDNSTKNWINGKLFKLIYQNILLEQNEEVLELSCNLYTSMLKGYNENKGQEKSIDFVFSKYLTSILHLLITPIGEQGKNYAMDVQHITKPSSSYLINLERKRSSNVTNSNTIVSPRSNLVNIDSPMLAGDVTLLGSDVIFNTRVTAAKILGLTLSYFQESTLKSFFENVLASCLDLPYATPRILVAIVLSAFCYNWKHVHGRDVPAFVSSLFSETFLKFLNGSVELPVFRELTPILKALRTQCQSLMSTFVDVGMLPPQRVPPIAIIVKGEPEAGPEAFSIQTAEKVQTDYYAKLFSLLPNAQKILAKKPLEDSCYRVTKAIESAKESEWERQSGVLSSFASAVMLIDGLPNKLNPIIRSLMDNVKSEKHSILQRTSGDSVITLINELIKAEKNNVVNKIVKNLCGFLCVDTTEIPEFDATHTTVIMTLLNEAASLSLQEDAEVKKISEAAQIKRKGGLYTLSQLLLSFQDKAFDAVPQLRKSLLEPLDKAELLLPDENGNFDRKIGQEIVDAFGIIRSLFTYMSENIQQEEILSRLHLFKTFLKSNLAVIRYSAARTLSELACHKPVQLMSYIITDILPMLNNAGSVTDRQGVVELLYHLSIQLQSEILPYVVFLIVPLLGRMSDSNEDIRKIATTTFASIIKLVPLEAGIEAPVGLSEELMKGREKERDFIQQMMDPSKAKPFKLPVAIKATLRKYQQEGINWLAFLNKYHLHGILCDDMGLGKTLQTICIMASDQYLRAEDYKKTKSEKTRPLPSLVICPPSLTGHWEQEFQQYAPTLKVLVYAGGPSVRLPLQGQVPTADIVITSYDVARNDIDFVKKFDYNYCVLDEGHIIKNSQSKLAKAVKLINSNHRLVLTGTPIQNNVVELWSLFDFLMPGFLGTEKMFQERFAKPIASSRNSKTSSKEQEAGALALEALHKQVLPFMLRRLKEDVLSDLPPKIIQDYYCELSDLQKQLYNDFVKKQKNVVEKDIENTTDVENKQHIFQALQYMRKLCNHPSLVLNASHPQYHQVQSYLSQTGMDLHDINHAPKLEALKTLLLECGIGLQDIEKKTNRNPSIDNVISQHRVLIFCQLKDMLDMVENDLLRKHLPSVTFMRLDGSVDSRDRQKVVRKFNEDPSIDCLLLTTKVGGLGLNLTGADTVIFVEHDWNPMNDLQAMDRAHRLGQKKVVNVYRIITKGTLEEKIMGLQKFKMNIASTIVNQQNAGLSSMNTHQLLDLFDADAIPSQEKAEKKKSVEEIANETGLTGKAKEAVGELKELWDSSQYEEEYNLDNFIKTLR